MHKLVTFTYRRTLWLNYLVNNTCHLFVEGEGPLPDEEKRKVGAYDS